MARKSRIKSWPEERGVGSLPREEQPSYTVSARSLDMGTLDRLTADWLGTSLTLNQMLFSQMENVRKRARDLGMNSPWARRLLAMARTNVVGPNGFSFSARGKMNPDTLDERGNKELERLWALWQKPGICTMCGTLSLTDVMNLGVSGVLQDGEYIIRMIFGAPNMFGFSLSLIPVDLLDQNLNREQRRDESGRIIQNAIKLGVEVDEWDKPVRYYFKDVQDSPIGGGYSSASQKHISYPAEEIIHPFLPERPGQTRGLSFLVPAGVRTKMLNAYEEALVIHKRIAASKMAVLEPDPENPPRTDYKPGEENSDGSYQMEISPGSMEKLPPGWKLNKFDVEDVSDGFKDVSTEILRSIASAWNVNYNTLANNLSEVNYSSIRHGALEDRDSWMCLQRFMIERILDRIYGAWLKWTLTMGITFISPSNYERFMSYRFQGRRWDWIDPVKEETANKIALENRTISRHEICRRQGMNYDDIQEELDREAADAPVVSGASE